MLNDPYGQPTALDPYAPKVSMLQTLEKMKRGIAKMERLLHSMPEILNDATRAAVYRELIADLKKEKGSADYEAAYGSEGAKNVSERLESQIRYLEKYGWSQKYTVEGAAKTPDLEEQIDVAYVNYGAAGVLEMLQKLPKFPGR